MSKTPFIIFAIVALICVVVIPIWALGADGGASATVSDVEPRDEAAKEMFVTNCGPCHTLAAAGTDGVVGPDLDALLVPTATNTAENYEATYTRVLRAVDCGIGGRMPNDIVAGDEAKRVAQFVAAYAGQIGAGPTVDTSTAPTPDPPGC